MINNIREISQIVTESGIIVIPATIGITQIFKKFGFPNRYLPLVNIFLGIFAELLVLADIRAAITGGIILGLSAAGLYRSTKVVLFRK